MNKLLPLPSAVVLGRAHCSPAAHRPPTPVTVGLFLLALLLVVRLPAMAQAPAWQAAVTVATAVPTTSGDYSVVTATAADAAGNIYLTGRFSTAVTFGSISLASAGGTDIFVAKFNVSSNQFVWAQRAGGTGNDRALALVGSGGGVYVAGAFNGPTAGFGSTTLFNATTSEDVFVAKLTDAGGAGTFVWAQQAGGADNDNATSLAVSGTNVYVAGEFRSPSVGFGSASLINTELATGGSSDVFVAKITDFGSSSSFSWAQRAGGIGTDECNALAVSSAGVYLAGFFNAPSVRFGSLLLANSTQLAGGEGFVAKLTDAGGAGSFVWAQRAGGAGFDEVKALAVSGSNIYVAGSFGNAIASFGAISLLPTTTAPASNAFDIFVAKLADAGGTSSFVWAQKAGGTGADEITALAVSGTSVYVAGEFRSPTATFGNASVANNNTGGAIYDICVAKLTDAGPTSNFAWAQRAGGADSDFATGLVISGTRVCVTGHLRSPTATFSAINLTNATGLPVGFLATLTDPTLTATTASQVVPPTQLFPNPAHHTAMLRLPAGTAPAPLTLTDAQGRTVRHYPAPASPEAALNLQGLPVGLYLLRGAGPAQRLVIE